MDLRVSTIVGISKFSQPIHLQELYDSIETDSKITFIELGEQYKGLIDKKNLKKREKKTKKYFYNQATLHVTMKYKGTDKRVNVKLFNNGSIQMTGLKSVELGKQTLDYLVELVNSLKEDLITLGEYSIALFNTDFDIGFKVNREKLNRHLYSLGIYTSFEPCIYPGVNIKYYYKTSNQSGLCECQPMCSGKGCHGDCKKITIAVFNSGKIIITGGCNYDQCFEAHKFIKKILLDKKDEFIDK
jgi:TATA-box binding protein (TBP) (component of TFIID and TFIIIB)